MAGEELEVVRLRNDFYRDGFYKVFIATVVMLAVLAVLLATSLYLYSYKPAPVTFYTDNDLRAFPPVPVTQSYVKSADLIQWVSEVLPKMFTYDFVNYDKQLKELQQYFTPNGWAKLAPLLDKYANVKQIQTAKLFVNASANGTPTIPNQGIIEGRYGWWVQLPLQIYYSGSDRRSDTEIVMQVLVVRIPTTNNLIGIAIDNVLVASG